MVVDEETDAEGEADPQYADEDVDMAETDEVFPSSRYCQISSHSDPPNYTVVRREWYQDRTELVPTC